LNEYPLRIDSRAAITAACGKDETEDANRHLPDPCHAPEHHCPDGADHYRDAADHCCHYPDAADDHRNHDGVDDPHSAVDYPRTLSAADRYRDAKAYRQNPDAAADPPSAACSFRNRDAADDHHSAAYFRNPGAEDDPNTPDAAVHHRHPVAAADDDRLAADCSAVSRPAPYSQNPDAADDRQTA
jgi:hypothetical protein